VVVVLQSSKNSSLAASLRSLRGNEDRGLKSRSGGGANDALDALDAQLLTRTQNAESHAAPPCVVSAVGGEARGGSEGGARMREEGEREQELNGDARGGGGGVQEECVGVCVGGESSESEASSAPFFSSSEEERMRRRRGIFMHQSCMQTPKFAGKSGELAEWGNIGKIANVADIGNTGLRPPRGTGSLYASPYNTVQDTEQALALHGRRGGGGESDTRRSTWESDTPDSDSTDFTRADFTGVPPFGYRTMRRLVRPPASGWRGQRGLLAADETDNSSASDSRAFDPRACLYPSGAPINGRSLSPRSLLLLEAERLHMQAIGSTRAAFRDLGTMGKVINENLSYCSSPSSRRSTSTDSRRSFDSRRSSFSAASSHSRSFSRSFSRSLSRSFNDRRRVPFKAGRGSAKNVAGEVGAEPLFLQVGTEPSFPRTRDMATRNEESRKEESRNNREASVSNGREGSFSREREGSFSRERDGSFSRERKGSVSREKERSFSNLLNDSFKQNMLLEDSFKLTQLEALLEEQFPLRRIRKPPRRHSITNSAVSGDEKENAGRTGVADDGGSSSTAPWIHNDRRSLKLVATHSWIHRVCALTSP
jgi:hypothetical protein